MGRQVSNRGLRAADIEPGTCKMGKVNNEEVAIFNIDGKLYATQNKCTHMGGPLCEGAIWNDTVSCPWHGSEFNVRTGEVLQGPAEVSLKVYDVEVDDGMVHVLPRSKPAPVE